MDGWSIIASREEEDFFPGQSDIECTFLKRSSILPIPHHDVSEDILAFESKHTYHLAAWAVAKRKQQQQQK